MDIFKTVMYDRYYFMKDLFKDKLALLMMDTKNLMSEIRVLDTCKTLLPYVNDIMDTFNYSENHPSGIPAGLNKKVIEYFKDEAGGKIIVRYAGARPKSYSYDLDGERKRCKGIRGTAVRELTSAD